MFSLSELYLLKRILISDDIDSIDLAEAERIINREIKLNTTNYVTGERLPFKDES